MNITEQFLNFTLLGAEWVLWVLIFASVVSVGVMIERGMFFFRRLIRVETLAESVRKALAKNDDDILDKAFGSSPAMAARVALAGVAERRRGVDAVAEAMNREKARARQEHEQNLVILGTLGNNAPFIGLFGTVLGIIKAFHDLQASPEGGVEVVMSGISEALVATAVGLLVAIPAVIAFNFFNRRVRAAVSTTDTIAHVILGELHGSSSADPGEPAKGAA